MRGDPELHQFIGTKTCLVDVDPLHDFIGEHGLFERVYGSRDIEALRRIQKTIATMIHTYQGKMFFALVASSYCHGQFNNDDPRLETLCTTKEGCKLILPDELEPKFNLRFTKPGNSAFSADRFFDQLKIGSYLKNLWLTGLTLTSCIDATVRECRQKATKHIKIIIAEDAVAVRRSRHRDAQKLLKKWSHPSVENVYVFDSWRDVPIVSDPTTV